MQISGWWEQYLKSKPPISSFPTIRAAERRSYQKLGQNVPQKQTMWLNGAKLRANPSVDYNKRVLAIWCTPWQSKPHGKRYVWAECWSFCSIDNSHHQALLGPLPWTSRPLPCSYAHVFSGLQYGYRWRHQHSSRINPAPPARHYPPHCTSLCSAKGVKVFPDWSYHISPWSISCVPFLTINDCDIQQNTVNVL